MSQDSGVDVNMYGIRKPWGFEAPVVAIAKCSSHVTFADVRPCFNNILAWYAKFGAHNRFDSKRDRDGLDS
jgi:hypothetical protein